MSFTFNLSWFSTDFAEKEYFFRALCERPPNISASGERLGRPNTAKHGACAGVCSAEQWAAVIVKRQKMNEYVFQIWNHHWPVPVPHTQ